MIVDYNIVRKKCNFSSNILSTFTFNAYKSFQLKDLLDKKLNTDDNGEEVGSLNYIKKSPFIFIKSKSLQDDQYSIDLQKDTFEYIRPQVFKNMNIKKGDFIISKDSNIGTTGIFLNDHPCSMLSGALYKLPISKNKLYVFAFTKTKYFKNQLDLLVPKGATIRHAGLKFLDCYVPFPKNIKVIDYIEDLTSLILSIEKLMLEKENQINSLIDEDLHLNSNVKIKSESNVIKFKNINTEKRFDVGIYSSEFKLINDLIRNYNFGSKKLSEIGYSVTRGQNLQISSIGKSIYSSENHNDYYLLILSNDISENMTYKITQYLGSKKKLKKINYKDIIFTCRGNLGRTFVFCNKNLPAITNIDNMHITNENASLNENIMVSSYLHYLQKSNYLHNIAIQGSGADSFTKYHFDKIYVPCFSESLINKIALLYSNSFTLTMDFFKNKKEMLQGFGLYQLEFLKQVSTETINKLFDLIIGNKEVDIEEVKLQFISNYNNYIER